MPVQYVLRRAISLLPVLLIVSFGVFLLTYLIPGDAAVTIAGGESASPERIEEIREELGLNEPFLAQYWNWLSGALSGDLGTSLYENTSVMSELARRFPVTVSLAFGAMVVTLVGGFTLGITAALQRGSWIDRTVQATASLGIAMPSFWFALLLILVFSINLGWFPAIGYTPLSASLTGWLRTITLPSIALGLAGMAVVARQLRGSLIDVLSLDYVRTATARGLSRSRVIAKHALKNAVMPVLTLLGLQVAYLLGGTVIIEQIFGIPGVGKYIVDSVFTLDLPVVQGAVLFIALIVVAVNLLVDISYGFVNPKVRQG